MDLGEALRRRRMVRRHTGEPVDPSALDRIIAAGLSGPTAGNSQGVSIVAASDPDRIRTIAALSNEPAYVERGFDPWISTAGALLVLCAEPEAYRVRYAEPDKDLAALEAVPWWWVDLGATLMAVLLQTVAEGLGAGFLGAHSVPDLAELLEIPSNVEIGGIVTIGPAADDRRSKSLSRPDHRRDHREVWQD